MTTVIACRPLGLMVADTRISHGEVKFKSTKKVQRVGPFVVGVAGDYGRALTYLKVLAKAVRNLDGTSVPKLVAAEGEGELEMVVMSPHGLWYMGEDGTPIEIEEQFYCTGSGGSWATSSMRTQQLLIKAGLLPQFDLGLAMCVACEFDNDSGLPMVEVRLAGDAQSKAGGRRRARSAKEAV